MRFFVEPAAFPTIRYLCEFGPLTGSFSYPSHFHFEGLEEAGRGSPVSANDYDIIVLSNPAQVDTYRARVTDGKVGSTVPPYPSSVLILQK